MGCILGLMNIEMVSLMMKNCSLMGCVLGGVLGGYVKDECIINIVSKYCVMLMLEVMNEVITVFCSKNPKYW